MQGGIKIKIRIKIKRGTQKYEMHPLLSALTVAGELGENTSNSIHC
jgi:hypothetical protein